MGFEEYTALITQINKQLEQIASLTANQALAGCANESNPDFVALMTRHQKLIQESDRLSKEMISKFR
ncbi:hypothetical protein ACOA8B_003495 [Vibrio cholerae]|uniref:hypothetical protein n=1 Tax=Vibrio cholerae TaxID=666 RepID=UPI000E0BDC32|nr:hypothetical protein [Vibrio cholerae]